MSLSPAPSSPEVADELTGDDRDLTPAPGRSRIPWSEEDEVSLLEAVLEIVVEPLESFDPTVSPFGRIRRAVKGPFTDREVLDKIWELRRCCEESAHRSGAVAEISNKIWGSCGVQRSDSGNRVVMRYYSRKRKREPEQKKTMVA